MKGKFDLKAITINFKEVSPYIGIGMISSILGIYHDLDPIHASAVTFIFCTIYSLGRSIFLKGGK